MDMLFKNIELANWKCPILHIRLGVGNELVNAIRDYIRKKLEKDLPFIAEQRG